MSASLSCSIVVIGGTVILSVAVTLLNVVVIPIASRASAIFEGIVAKSVRGRCQSDGRSTSWLKIKNEDCSRDGAALNGRRLYWGGNSQTVPLLNSPALGQKKEFKCSLKLR